MHRATSSTINIISGPKNKTPSLLEIHPRNVFIIRYIRYIRHLTDISLTSILSVPQLSSTPLFAQDIPVPEIPESLCSPPVPSTNSFVPMSGYSPSEFATCQSPYTRPSYVCIFADTRSPNTPGTNHSLITLYEPSCVP